MKIIITASGNSERFINCGYPTKSLVKVNNRLVIDYVLDMFPYNSNDIIFTVNDYDVHKYPIECNFIKRCSKSQICVVPKNNLGPVYSIHHIFDKIPDNEEIVVSYCDLTQRWDFWDFIEFCRNNKVDGCIVTHKGKFPHQLYNTSFAFLNVDNHNNVLKVNEKEPIDQNIVHEKYASNGIYYFKSGDILKKYFKKLLDNKISVNGEYYVTLPYNLMIEDKLNVMIYNTDNYICLGTPNDIINFESWSNIIYKCNLKNIQDVDWVYSFWKNNVS